MISAILVFNNHGKPGIQSIHNKPPFYDYITQSVIRPLIHSTHCFNPNYRVGHLLADLGWVDLDLECSIILPGQ